MAQDDAAGGGGAGAGGALAGGIAAAAVVFAGMVYWALVARDAPPATATDGAPAQALLSPAEGAASGSAAGGRAANGATAAPAAAPETAAQTDVQTDAQTGAQTGVQTGAQPEAQTGAPVAAATAAGATADPAAATAASATDAAPTNLAPTNLATTAFDALRVTPEGEMTLAGRVEPGARVEVLLDGQVIDTVTAGADGAFASVVLGTPAAEARALSLRVTGADGVARPGAESLTVAPSPLALAKAATAAGAAPEVVAEQVAAAQLLAEKPLLSTAGGAVQVLAGQAAALLIDTLGFGADGALRIAGRGAPEGAVLRAYIDNVEAGLARPAADGGWTLALPAAGPGPHALRVDALDAAGKVLARAEQGFEGLAPPAPEAAPEAADTGAEMAAAGAAPAAGTGVPAEGVVGGAAAAAGGAAAGSGGAAGGAVPHARLVTIAPGNTLWAIARDTYGDPYLYLRLFEANRDQIRDPDLIYPGQVFTLPE